MQRRWRRRSLPKWKVGYAAYQEAVKNVTATLVIDDKDDDSWQKALPPRPWGHKPIKVDLARQEETGERLPSLPCGAPHAHTTLGLYTQSPLRRPSWVAVRS
jgi:hypothetical protein